MAGPESILVTKIVKAIIKEWPGSWIFKVVGSPYQMTGVPDILVCVEGMLAGVEVKALRPGETREAAMNRVTPGQRVQIQRINAAGGAAGAAVSVEEALDIIRRGLARRANGEQ